MNVPVAKGEIFSFLSSYIIAPRFRRRLMTAQKKIFSSPKKNSGQQLAWPDAHIPIRIGMCASEFLLRKGCEFQDRPNTSGIFV